jgi:hypothetical protein
VRAKSLTAFFLGTLFLLQTAAAQVTRGTITGVVTDGYGGVIASATVAATNTATGVTSETRTSSTRNYVLRDLQVGSYTAKVSMDGFKGDCVYNR